MKILDKVWFTHFDKNIGIVKVDFENGDGEEFFIGLGGAADEEADAKRIAEWGTRISFNFLKQFFLGNNSDE